jgi:hypothetical protein
LFCPGLRKSREYQGQKQNLKQKAKPKVKGGGQGRPLRMSRLADSSAIVFSHLPFSEANCER